MQIKKWSSWLYIHPFDYEFLKAVQSYITSILLCGSKMASVFVSLEKKV